MLFDSEMDINMLNNLMNTNLNINYDNNITSDKIGLQRGNMFNKEYKTYKNLNPSNIVANTDNDSLCLKLFETNFAIIDLNLYLDLHPDDNEIYNLYKKYVVDFENYKKEYEKYYGPLEINDIDNNTYEWLKNPWPWDKNGGIKYV